MPAGASDTSSTVATATATGVPAATGASIDSRTLKPGQLFVPIIADSDGHAHIKAAHQAGAAAYLTSQPPLDLPIPAVKVEDTTRALSNLARAARQEHDFGTVIGITGSVGKTTTKDFTARVLAAKLVCSASEQSFNNNLGVPLTILNAPGGCQALVTEIGASRVGEIKELCEIAKPDYGVLTSIGKAHLEGFGSLDNLCRAKGELLEALPAGGVAVLNGDDELVMTQAGRSGAGTVLVYGTGAAATPPPVSASATPPARAPDVLADDISLDDRCCATYHLRSPWGNAQVRLAVPGAHNVSNSLAAATVALSLGIKPEAVADELAQAELSPWRMDLQQSKRGFWVLNDSYNSNPTSAAAALRTLADLPAGRKVAVLGTMAELGDFHEQGHVETAELASELGLELVAVGEPAYGVPTEPNQEAVLEQLGDLAPGDAVLVKASRSVGLEILAQALLE